MKIYSQENYQPLLQRGGFEDEQRLAIVKGIVSDVKTNGDKALFAYAEKFDDTCLTAQTIAVSQEEIDEAYRVIDKELLTSLRLAVKNIAAWR